MRGVCVGVMAMLLLTACSSVMPSPSSSAIASDVPLSPPLSSTPPTTAAGHFVAGELSFDFPGGWNQAFFDEQSSFSRVIVFLSTEPLHEPCTTRANSVGTETDCGSPIADNSLGSDGVLVTWLGMGFPGWSFDPNVGALGQIGGKAATVDDQAAPEVCKTLGGERWMVATVPRSEPYNWYEMDACYAGPDLSGVRAQLHAMLDSVVWTSTP